MSQKQYIKIEKKEGIFLIGLNRPEERNAINTEMILQLSDALTQYEDDYNSRCAVHGFCLTLGIDLMLACDIVIAAEKTKFAQLEVQRGITPIGGSTIRFVRSAGWGNAMRYLLTGDVFSAEEAYRLGLVQEIVPKKNLLESAIQLAKKIAEQAPLSIKATLENSRKYVMEGEGEATKNLVSITAGLLKSQDGKEGIQSFLEKRKANFLGK